MSKFFTIPRDDWAYLDGAVDLAHEPEAGEEADGPGEQKEGDRDHAHVREVDEDAHAVLDVELRDEVPVPSPRRR